MATLAESFMQDLEDLSDVSEEEEERPEGEDEQVCAASLSP
jgi:hypothetical protein